MVARYRLVAGSDRLEVEVILDKLPVRAKESAHLTFDLAVEGGRLRIDQGWNLMDPARDALPGSCRDFVGVHSALDASGASGGVSLGVLDSPLVELGSLVDERPGPTGIRQWRQEPYAGTIVHAYLLNNYWHTNYKADQSGALRFRFVLRPHGLERPGTVTSFSRDLEQPLVVLPAAARPRGALLPLEAGAGVQVVGVRPAGEGRAVLMRLLNASDEGQEVRSEEGQRTALAPWETFTLRVE